MTIDEAVDGAITRMIRRGVENFVTYPVDIGIQQSFTDFKDVYRFLSKFSIFDIDRFYHDCFDGDA